MEHFASRSSSGNHKPSLTANGDVGTCVRKKSNIFFMASSQNIPAVLNDPGKGKQKDFFTRTWGESFTDLAPLPPSRHSSNLSTAVFEKYLRKLNKYRGRGAGPGAPSAAAASSAPESVHGSRSSIPRMFWDPELNLSRGDTFGRVLEEKERLSHHLDAVEVDIAVQVSRKSHHFFEVMTYHDALMNRLEQLVRHVQGLRRKLQAVDGKCFRGSMEVCRLERRRSNLALLEKNLAVVSHLQRTQPKIQLLLSGNEFGSALDLIRTSRDVLSVHSFVSFRHLSSQLNEIQSIIGRMLLGDFQTYIADEIHRDVVREKATVVCEEPAQGLSDEDSQQLMSVIFGLLRQNSFTFLEVLEAASITALKNVFKEVAFEMLLEEGEEGAASSSTVASLSSEFAKKSTSDDWIKFFDVLLGSLISLLRRIHAIHSVIVAAIDSAAASSSVPQRQLATLQASSNEALDNICDQAVERSSKILSQRSKPEASRNVTLEELRRMFGFVDLLLAETTGKVSLQLSLQSQTLIFVQGFHEAKRLRLSELLEKEKWKKSEEAGFANRLFGVDFAAAGPGTVAVDGCGCYSVTGSALSFLLLLDEYCVLADALPSASSELGLRAAELVKFFNSRICQLVLGVGALSVSGLKTITIRNLALAKRSLELVARVVVPAVRARFVDTRGESLKRQFAQAENHLSNHVGELQDKILAVVEQILQQHLSSWNLQASANFKALCRQVVKLHESVEDVWPKGDVAVLMCNVHKRFMACVAAEIAARKMNDKEAAAFKAELALYQDTVAKLDVVPEELLERHQRAADKVTPNGNGL